MKKIVSIITIISFISCGQGGDKQNTNDVPAATAVNTPTATTNVTPPVPVPADWKTYTQENYTIHYPPSWNVREGPGVAKFTILFSPDKACSNMGENVSLGKQDIGDGSIDLDELAQSASTQFKTMLDNYSLISHTKLTDGTGDYEQTIFTGEMSSQKLIYEQRYRVINGKIYILTLACPKEGWDVGQKIGEQIMSLFSVTP